MPGYNVVGPAEAFSSTLEDAVLKHEAAIRQAKIEERQAKLDQMKLEHDKAYLDIEQEKLANQREDRQTTHAEKAAAAKEKEGTDIASRLVTGDVVTPDIAAKLPAGLVSPGTPGTPAVPAGPNTTPLPGTDIPVEREMANATPAVAAAPATFRGLPAARIAAQKTAAQNALIEAEPDPRIQRAARFAQSGLPISELNPPKETDVKVSYRDPKTGKNMEKWVSPAQAKEMGPQEAPTPASVVIHNMGAADGEKSGGLFANEANDVQDVLEGRQSLANIRLSMGRTKEAGNYMAKMRKLIHEQDPTFDFALSDAGTKAVSTPYYQKSKVAIDALLPNISRITDLSNQIPRVGVKGVDDMLQKGAVQIGNVKVTSFKQMQKLVADEIGVALGSGTVSDMKLQLGIDVTDPAVSQESFAAQMHNVEDFVRNRERALLGLRYRSSTKGEGGVGSEGTTPGNAEDAAYAAYLKNKGGGK